MSDAPETLDDFALAHFGTKGMRWGVRNERSLKSGPASDHRAPDSAEHHPLSGASDAQAKAARKGVKSDVRTLSDAQLKDYINRLDTEKRLRGLVNEDVAPGRTAIQKTMNDSGHKVLKTVLVATGTYVAAKVVAKYLNEGLGKQINANAVATAKKAAEAAAKV